MQFNVVQSAAKAIHYANMQSLLNRPMIVDWAVPKNKFSENTDIKPEIKTESIDENELHDTSEIKVIGCSEDEDSESDAESDRYLKIQIVCVAMDPNLYFLSLSLFFFLSFFLSV